MKITFVLDGNKEFLNFADRHLKIYGYQVQTFQDPNQLLKALKLNPFFIIIGDGFSPDINVYALFHRIKKVKSSSTIIHIAEQTSGINAIESEKAGAYEFIEKDGAVFVRLRTTIELIEEKSSLSIFSRLKKALAK